MKDIAIYYSSVGKVKTMRGKFETVEKAKVAFKVNFPFVKKFRIVEI